MELGSKEYPFRGRGVYEIIGTVNEELDCITIEVSKMQRLAVIEDPRYAIQSTNPTFQKKKSFQDLVSTQNS